MVRNNIEERRPTTVQKAIDRLELAIVGILHNLGHDAADQGVSRIVARRLRIAAGGRSPESGVMDVELSSEPLPARVPF